MKLILALATLVGTSCVASGMSDAEVERLADAIWHAEGGRSAKVSHGILSVKTRNPRQVCLNTIRKTWGRWEAAGKPGDFVDFLGARYAPVGAKNDPRGLNRHWPRNVRSRLHRLRQDSVQNTASARLGTAGGASR